MCKMSAFVNIRLFSCNVNASGMLFVIARAMGTCRRCITCQWPGEILRHHNFVGMPGHMCSRPRMFWSRCLEPSQSLGVFHLRQGFSLVAATLPGSATRTLRQLQASRQISVKPIIRYVNALSTISCSAAVQRRHACAC